MPIQKKVIDYPMFFKPKKINTVSPPTIKVIKTKTSVFNNNDELKDDWDTNSNYIDTMRKTNKVY